ncbi:MAG TPA: LLM class flavin-dependent oxidoreductase [Stellaceae bacterium]|nr:LLM class flavin-dependent oxidoreductase [Stellaceae bacterium]
MKVGIFDHLDRGDVTLTQFYEERIEFIAAAEAFGIASYHLAEHHWNPVGMAPLPGMFLAAAAKRTTRIRLGPLAYVLAFHNPMILAEEICMLDHLSGGRLDLGVGRGISPWELSMLGVTPSESRDIFREAMDVMMQYFTGDSVTHRGARWRFYDVPVEIKPLQLPFPPIWYGSASGATRDYIAALGGTINAGWAPSARVKQAADAYREAWQRTKDAPFRAGSAAAATVGSVRMVVVAETDAEAEATARPAYERWYQSLEKLAHSFGFAALFVPPDYEVARRRIGSVIAGSPATVRAELLRHIEESSIDYPLLQVSFGAQGHAQQMRTLQLLASEVLPQIARIDA